MQNLASYRDRAGCAELKTSELTQVEQFLRQFADRLDSLQIAIRKKGNLFIAECFDAPEPPI